jgi:hypothetical protein
MLRKHALLLCLTLVFLVVLAWGTWGCWYNFAQDQEAHHQTAQFFSWDFFSFWTVQQAMNFQAEVLGFILIIVSKNKIRKLLNVSTGRDDEEV